MSKVRLGIVGVGNMGRGHINNYAEGRLPEIEITAVADIDPSKFAFAQEKIPGVKYRQRYAHTLKDRGAR